MRGRRGSDWLAPGLLLALCVVPSVAGVVRLAELAGSGPVSDANRRFFASPLPVILHVLAVVPFGVLGALQFAPSIRRRWPAWHRRAGRALATLGAVAAFTGLWMAHFYPMPAWDGRVVYVLRLVFGSAMLFSIGAGADAARRRDFVAHGEWMRRGYAIGMGAGTQVLTHLPWFLLVGTPGMGGRALAMGAGWVVNLAVAELVIRRRRVHEARRAGSAGIARLPVRTGSGAGATPQETVGVGA